MGKNKFRKLFLDVEKILIEVDFEVILVLLILVFKSIIFIVK